VPQIAFKFSAAGVQTWTPATDLNASSFGVVASATGRVAVISADPNVSATDIATPSANSVDENLLAAAMTTQTYLMALPLSAGQRVFVALSGAGTAVIAYDTI
jgi:hypothetical protein